MRCTMKKLVLVSLAALALAACGDKESAQDQKQTEENVKKEENGEKLVVDKNLTNVEVTMPASMFQDQTKEDIEEAAKQQGIKEVRINDDGSVYYKMSKATHKEALTKMKASLEESLDTLVNGENFTSFKDASANKDFTKFTITVNQEAYEDSFDGFGLLGLGIAAMYHDLFSGTPGDKLDIEMKLVDEATGETINTIHFPEDLNKEEEQED